MRTKLTPSEAIDLTNDRRQWKYLSVPIAPNWEASGTNDNIYKHIILYTHTQAYPGSHTHTPTHTHAYTHAHTHTLSMFVICKILCMKSCSCTTPLKNLKTMHRPVSFVCHLLRL